MNESEWGMQGGPSVKNTCCELDTIAEKMTILNFRYISSYGMPGEFIYDELKGGFLFGSLKEELRAEFQ